MVSSIELPLPRDLNTRDSKMPPDLSEARKRSREHRKSKHLSAKEQKDLFDQLHHQLNGNLDDKLNFIAIKGDRVQRSDLSQYSNLDPSSPNNMNVIASPRKSKGNKHGYKERERYLTQTKKNPGKAEARKYEAEKRQAHQTKLAEHSYMGKPCYVVTEGVSPYLSSNPKKIHDPHEGLKNKSPFKSRNDPTGLPLDSLANDRLNWKILPTPSVRQLNKHDR